MGYISNISQYLPINSSTVQAYLTSLDYSKALKRIEHNKMSLTGKVGQAKLLTTTELYGRFVWIVQVPVKQLWLSGTTPLAYEIPQIFTVKLVRYPVSGIHPQGFAVYQIYSERPNE